MIHSTDSEQALLQAKLHIPPARPFLVPPPHLVHQLGAGLEGCLTLISAPAGFGKTTLVGECIRVPQAKEIIYCWVSLDEKDRIKR